MFIPLPRASAPKAKPLAYIRSLLKVAPVVIPAGKAVILSVVAIPSAESSKQRLGMPNLRADPVLPVQRPYIVELYVWQRSCEKTHHQ